MPVYRERGAFSDASVPMSDDERREPRTFEVDTLEALGPILRAGAQLTCKPDGFFLLTGPGEKSGAGGHTIAAAVSGYIETVLNDNLLRRAQSD